MGVDSTLFGGMKGSQLAAFTNMNPIATNNTMTDTLVITIILLKLADSLIPTTRRAERRATMNMAGRLRIQVTWGSASTLIPEAASVWAKASVICFHPISGTLTSTDPVAPVNCGGIIILRSFRKLTTYPDHPTDTVDAANRYSSIRSHPIIQARNSPRVAYE